MKVSLMHHTPLHIAAFAGHVCTDTEGTSSYHDKKVREFLEKLVEAGHKSVLEHLVYTFNVEELSRACLQELARHRHVSLSVKSTRWALKQSYEEQAHNLLNVINRACGVLSYGEREEQAEDNSPVNMLVDSLIEHMQEIERGMRVGLPNDILKYFLPECFTTDLVLTANARELRHIMALRSRPNALREFQWLCAALYRALPPEQQFLFLDCFPKTEDGHA